MTPKENLITAIICGICGAGFAYFWFGLWFVILTLILTFVFMRYQKYFNPYVKSEVEG
jgi:hypothetical protein